MVGNHFPFPLRYEGRVGSVQEAGGGPKGLRALITAKVGDVAQGYAVDKYCRVNTRWSEENWKSTGGVARVLSHEVAHLLGMEHCVGSCLFSQIPELYSWNLCDEHQRFVRTIARVLYTQGWEEVATM